MKSLVQFIQEKLIIKKNKAKYNYFPETKQELQNIIKQRIEQEGNEVDLNDIDVSKIKNMSELFYGLNFNCDISNWNVSNVTDMSFMFNECKEFNQDISNWDVSKVTDMSGMFGGCKEFNQDISSWNVSNVIDMSWIFYGCNKFNRDISNWDISNVINMYGMFNNCPIEKKHKPKF